MMISTPCLATRGLLLFDRPGSDNRKVQGARHKPAAHPNGLRPGGLADAGEGLRRLEKLLNVFSLLTEFDQYTVGTFWMKKTNHLIVCPGLGFCVEKLKAF